MINQHWFRQWLGAIRQQAITWANVDTDICLHMVSLGHNALILFANYCKQELKISINIQISNFIIDPFDDEQLVFQYNLICFQKLPNKFKKLFADFEQLMDPSRNHRAYRLAVAKMDPPIIPFMPLLMKGQLKVTVTDQSFNWYFLVIKGQVKVVLMKILQHFCSVNVRPRS